jgi:hypothetical protein
MKMKFRATALILALLAIASLTVVLSKNGRRLKTLSERRETTAAPVDALQQPAMMPEGMEMGAHMRMTAPRSPRPGDQERTDEIAARARAAIEKYKDYSVALGDGYRILLPRVPQKMYHFNNAQYFLEAESRFNPEHPTSLLYEKSGGGYRLIGVMYTAPAELKENELDERVPLSVASWHQHVNLCLPKGNPLQELFATGPRFGLHGSISTQAECEKAGGQFLPRLLGWMIHLYPYEKSPAAMWSVERQMSEARHTH